MQLAWCPMNRDGKSQMTAPRRIIVAEDEPDLRHLLQVSLSRSYAVEAVTNGLEALAAFDRLPADMVILDILMPKMDGFRACEELRRRSDVPIIMLTALDTLEDATRAFELGADDYITKPFSFRELRTRVEIIFRRLNWIRHSLQPSTIVNGELKIDADSKQVWRYGNELRLTPIEFQLLYYLGSRPGRDVRDAELFREVWGYDLVAGASLVEAAVQRLREKIEPDPARPQMILTARGVGYRFRQPPSHEAP